MVNHRLLRGVLTLALVGAVAAPASGSHWPFFGGDAGRSGHQPAHGGVAPMELLWSATDTPDVITSVVTTAGPPGMERVAYGTGDRRDPDGDIIGGRVHVRTAVGGVPVTPPEGIKLSDEADAFGDGFGSISFADTSTATELGQLWVVYNDVNGVSIAQIDEATGELVQKRLPNPDDVNEKLVGITTNSAPLISPPDPNGTRSLFFVAFDDVVPIETLYKVTVHRAGSRDAEISTVTTANGDFNLVDYASPSLVWLTANASNNEAHVAVGDCRGRLYTFAVDDLAPGPIAALGADTDCVLTASAPVTSAGVPPGAEGSGLGRTPVIYVATTDSEGRTTRVHRIFQETSVQFRRQPDEPPVLAGGPATALAVDATVLPSGQLDPGGRVYVTTGQNLYVIDAKDLTQVVARLDPHDALVPGTSGFSQATPAVDGGLLFVSRDNGEHLVLDKQTLAPVATGSFVPAAGSEPVPGSLAFGGPSLSKRMVIYSSTRGVFAYRLRAPAPPSGYWLAAEDGAVFTFGDAGFFGSMAGQRLPAPIVAMAASPSGGGYWLAGRDGAVHAFGDAGFFGSAAGTDIGSPVVGMAATPTGRGYWLVSAAGGVFSYGDAGFFGSAAGAPLGSPVVGMAATPTGRGYWLATADGGVLAYGDARFFGSAGGALNAPVVGMAVTPAGNGYWLVAGDGGVFSYGAAGFRGSAADLGLARPVVGLAGGASGAGYTLTAGDGGVFAYGDNRFLGSTTGKQLDRPVVGIAATG